MLKLTFGDRFMVIMIYIFLTLLAFVTFYPFWNSLVISFNNGQDTMLGGVTFWPRDFTLDNYEIVFQDKRLVNAFMISVARTVVGTILSVLATAMLAYGLSKKELVGRKYFMVFCIVTMFFSGGLIPTFLLVRGIGLMDSFWVMIIPSLILVWNMIIFRTFFQQLPKGLEESAKIDGAGYWGIFFRIVLPLSGPVIATLSLFTAVFHWNDWFFPSIYITSENLIPIQTLLQKVLNSNTVSSQMSQIDAGAAAHMGKAANTVTGKSLSMAVMMVATLPIIMVYPFVQKYFVKGVLIGSLKE
ncbi:MAG: carbohydrate ABC transporter permease [Bacillota bacterium]|uniref:Carbohydrate ABC transporter permease n=1 Tax=Virgibacillus salarius TaxID=447199 RepID=A0A941I9M6_9BACI|nr:MULTISPECIES: carbohydrate ABC transporter permease [Bacillaceae]NAZ08421.1 ABC transporter permease subunit [Agaribacter marinus]MBR7795708.1 carbohydrate ABC transporter permease [Virgibacillus salarius]MCC2248586.1 carbohydrate ABC transporter permease [Virgibacillus sp. AGTR]MDY7043212.1 carbohydrate ABC transporter permease [Virgibacillus sp. M23]QRZ18343.1 carbohydrate ABC transporter permease [Virgibacillus sp. AGTR]